MVSEELLQRLKLLDEEAELRFDDDRRFRMIIVGGAALLLLDTISRATRDIDALDATAEIQTLLEKYDINMRVTAYMFHFPYNLEDRLVPVRLLTKKIDYYTASLEDIVVSKLYSERDTDRQDILSPEVLAAIDWDVLEHLVYDEDEAKANAYFEQEYQSLLYNYEEYRRRYRPCGN